MSAPLEQIARLLREVGYWKSPVHVQHYYRQDVYLLGKSAQRLFDDYAALDERVKQFQAQLVSIKEHRHMKPEATPHEAFEGLATAMDEADAQALVDAAVVAVLEQPTTAERFKWPFVTLSILLQRAVKRKVTHHL